MKVCSFFSLAWIGFVAIAGKIAGDGKVVCNKRVAGGDEGGIWRRK